MPAVELGTAYLTLAASTKGFVKEVGSAFGQAEGTAAASGKRMGKAITSGLASASGASVEKLQGDLAESEEKLAAVTERTAQKRRAAQSQVEKAIQGVKSAQDQASVAAQRVSAAQDKLDHARVDGAKSVEVAEKALQELRESGSAKGSQIAAAEQKVSQARARASEAVSNAEMGVMRARTASEASSQKVQAAEDKVTAARRNYTNVSRDGVQQITAYKGAVDDSSRKLAEAKNASEQAAGAAEQAGGAFSRMGGAIRSALKGDFKGAFSTIKGDAAGAADGVEHEFQEASTEGAGSMESAFSGVLGKLPALVGAAGIGAALTNGIGESMSQARLTDKLAAQLDLTKPQAEMAGRIAGSLYSHAYGDSMESVNEAVGAVMSTIKGMSNASQGDIERVSGYAMNLASAFDIDVNDAVGAVGVLMNNGLAKDADSAFDQITLGMQKIPAGFRGELTDAVKEYSKHFEGLGLSGEQAISMLVKASDQGEIGIDKMGDAIKEFQIRSTDMSTSTKGAYEDLGLSTEEMTGKLLAGGDSAKEAFGQIINALLNVDDPARQSQDTLALFGTQMEDLGVDKIPDMLKAMDPAAGTLEGFGGAAEKMGDTLNDNAATRVEEFKRTLAQGWVEAVGGALEAFDKLKSAVAPVVDFLKSTVDVWGPFAAGIGIVAAAVAVWAGWQSILNLAVGAFTGIMAVLTTPITWIIVALGLLVGAVIYAWQNFSWFHDAVVAVWNGIVTVVQWAWETILLPVFQAIASFVMDVLVPAFMWLWQSVIVPAWNAIAAVVSWAWTTIIQPLLQAMWAFITTVLAPVFTWFWQSIIVPVWNAIGAVISWAWNSVIVPIFNAISAFINGVLAPVFWWLYNGVIQPVWTVISWAIGAAWTIIKNIFQAIWWVITNVLGPIFNWLYNSVVKPVWDWIVAAIQYAWNTQIKPIWDAIKGFITGVLGPWFQWLYNAVVKPVWDAISTAIQWAWNNVIKPAWDAIKWFIDSVLGPVFWWLLNNVIRPVWDAIGGKIRAVTDFIRTKVLDPLAYFLQHGFMDAWTKTKDGIKEQWDKLRDAVKKPIQFVVDKVVNPFIGGFNKINDIWHGDDIKKMDIGFARGGYTGPGSKYQPAGIVHADEFVVKKSSRRKFEAAHPGWLDTINRTGELPQKPEGLGGLPRAGRNEAWAGTVPPHGPSGGIWGSMQAQASRAGKMKFADTSIFGASTREAAKAWMGRSALKIEMGGGGPGVSRFVNGAAGGWGFYSGNTIQVNGAAVPRNRVKGVLVHEMGHALGLGHTAGHDSSSVMDHFMTGGDWPHSGDYQALRETWGQPGKGVKTYENPGGGGDSGSSWIADLIRDKVKSLINAPLESAKKAFPYPFAQLPISLFQKMLDQVIDWATGGGSDSGEDPGGSGVERWRGTVKQALARVGLPTSSDYVEAWLRQIQTESGGNPKAVQGNIGDINNATGNLAQGLVQVIPPTFRANRDPSLPDDPFNPLANLVAGMRYAKATYGSQGMLRAIGKGHGYSEGGLVRPALFDGGGVLDRGVQFIDHQRTRPDYVLSEPQWQAMYAIAEKQAASGEIHMHMETRDQDPTIMGRRAGEALAWQMEKVMA